MSAFADFHFLRPLWLLALLALPLLAWAWRRHARQDDPWRRVVDPHLLPALSEPAAASGSRGHGWLLWLLPTVAVLALAGPAWQQLPQPLLRNESALVIALDLSARMRAADLPPDRLQRARFKIADLLRERRDGQIALVAYAGDAFTVAPLTNDAATLESLLAALEPDVMPAPGQRADRAIRRAQQLISDAGFGSGDLLLLTDRADPRDIEAAAAARAAGVRVSVLGVGTEQGAPIPLPGGSFASDPDGRPQMASLDAGSLRRLADAGGGRYIGIRNDLGDLRRLALFDPAADAMRDDDGRDSAPRYRDHGPWLLLLLLPLAALSFRRGWLGCLPLVLLLPPAPASALDWADLWWRPEQQAQQALEAGDLERARALARDPLRRGSAAYRADDFAEAGKAFAADDSADGHYNRGNALARAGDLQQAIDAYDEALSREPGMPDAIANRAAVMQALQQQQQQQQQQKQDGDAGEQKPSPSEQPAEPQEGEPGEQGEPGEDDASGTPQDGEAEQPSDAGDESPPGKDGDASGDVAPPPEGDAAEREQQQQALGRDIDEAMQQAPEQTQAGEAIDPAELEAQQASEQLLRRVPDDPGGLLRRKFALEHRRRVSEGQGEDR